MVSKGTPRDVVAEFIAAYNTENTTELLALTCKESPVSAFSADVLAQAIQLEHQATHDLKYTVFYHLSRREGGEYVIATNQNTAGTGVNASVFTVLHGNCIMFWDMLS